MSTNAPILSKSTKQYRRRKLRNKEITKKTKKICSLYTILIQQLLSSQALLNAYIAKAEN